MSDWFQFNQLQYFTQKLLRKKLIQTVSLTTLSNARDFSYPLASLTVPTPEVQEIPLKQTSQYYASATYSLPSIYTVTLANILYYAKYNVLLTNSRKLIAESLGYAEFNPAKFSLRTLYLSKVEKLSGTYSLFRTIKNHNNYYHSLIDNLPRLYLLTQPQYNNIPEIKLLIPGKLTKTESFFLPKVLPKNVVPSLVDSQKIYSIEKLIFPSILTKAHAGYLPQEYLEYFMNNVKLSRKRNRKNRIYISRNKAASRRIDNEYELFDILQHHRFKKYFLEDLSPAEQMELFYDADYVVSAHGAGLTNIIFSQSIKILELFPHPYIIPHYYYLAKSLGHTYRYWCSDEKANKYCASFKVKISEISKYLVN